MKKTFLLSFLFLVGIIFSTKNASAYLTNVPDKKPEPEFVCQTESDINIARTIAIKRGGGPDFAGSSEVLCRQQIEAYKAKNNTTIIYQQTSNSNNSNSVSDDQIKLTKELACKSTLYGGELDSNSKCTCPTGETPFPYKDTKDKLKKIK